MADHGRGAGSWRRPAEQRAARRRAAASAEGAIRRLSNLLAVEREAALAWGAPGVRQRLRAAAPALAALCSGGSVAPAARLQRNVALHAAVLPRLGAPIAAWRAAQKGPRLGDSFDGGSGFLQPPAAPAAPRRVNFAVDFVDILEFVVVPD